MDKNPVYILGISAFYHDSAACLVCDGVVVAAAQEERFTRKKHDHDFPSHAVAYCFQEAGITAQDLTYVAFYDKPFLKFERLLMTYVAYAPAGLRSFLKSMPLWLKEKLYMKDLVREKLGYDGEIIFPEHHESHAASAFFPSPFKEAAVLTMDGVGEWATASYGVGQGRELNILADIRFPHSLGLLYSAFTYYVGFRVNSGEYKLMGLAPYGEPKFTGLIRDKLVDIKDDGSFKLDMRYFNYCAGLTMTSQKFHDLFGGPPRKSETELRQRDMDIARSIQDVTEEIMLKMAIHVHKTTGMKNLCLAGGVALNCVGNGKILKDSPFENVWIQPAAGDAGGALGAALFTWHMIMAKPRAANDVDDLQSASLLGPRFSEKYIKDFLVKNNIPHEYLPDDELARRVAKYMNEENVIGFVQGRMEFGPRALGARSIIGDARSTKMQSVMNLKIKFRESFRPFAPAVLREQCSEYFDMDADSPYMLLVSQVREDKIDPGSYQAPGKGIERLKVKRSVIPAVTHVDYSARVQTVTAKSNPLFYKVIKEFKAVTGCPVVINTSFNIRGEPIVCTPEDAYRCFMCTDMDYLVLENFVIDKKRQINDGRYKKDKIVTVLD